MTILVQTNSYGEITLDTDTFTTFEGELIVSNVDGAYTAIFAPGTWNYARITEVATLKADPTRPPWQTLKDVPPSLYNVFDRTGRKWQSYAGQSWWRTASGPDPRDTRSAAYDAKAWGPFTDIPPS